MVKYRLKERERRVLCAAQLNADLTYGAIGTLCGESASVVRNTLLRLQERGVIYRRPIITYGSFGYHSVCIYFSYAGRVRNADQVLLAALLSEPRVAGAYSLGGRFHYGVVLLVRTFPEVFDFLRTLQETSDIRIVEKEFSTIISSLLFRRDYLATIDGGRSEIENECSCTSLDVSPSELRVAGGLSTLSYHSHRDLARQLQMPQSTLEINITKLREKHIYKGMVYSFRERILSLLQYRLLIYSRGCERQIRHSIREFARKNAHVLSFIELFGTWDYEIELEVEDPAIALAVRRELISLVGSELISTELHQLFRYEKSSSRQVYDVA